LAAIAARDLYTLIIKTTDHSEYTSRTVTAALAKREVPEPT
jgi:hypothetical protein